MINIVITLERHFGYNRLDAIELAKEIYTQHKKEIKAYMKDWFKTGTREARTKYPNKRRALKEQRARGFTEIDELSINAELPYIKSNIKPLAWPKQWPFKKGVNMAGIYERFQLIGVSGFTRIVLPKRLYNK